jgi:lysophospholipase L1-like esterase
MLGWRSFGGPNLRAAARVLWLGLVGLATLEAAARVDDWLSYGASPVARYEVEGLFRQSGRGLRGIPHARYVRWELNSLGLRGPELRGDGGQVRVLAYGASETFGIYERNGNEYPRALEAALNARAGAGRFEVVNAGIPGMRVGSGIELLRDLGAQLKPGVVVIYPTPTHYIGVSRPYCGRPPRPPQASAGVGFESRIAVKAKDELKAMLPERAWTYARKLAIAWAMRSAVPLERVDPRSVDAFELDLRCAVRTVREIGAVPVVVTHANRFGTLRRDGDEPWLVGWRMQYPELVEGGFIDLENRANAVARRVAAAEGVALADAAAALDGRPGYFADHAHFTDEGAVGMATLLADVILGGRPPSQVVSAQP